MGAIYTRQSTYEDGDTITADHTNNEFDQLLAAFAASTGHTHDGTTGEGGPITSLLGTSLTFGNGTAGTDITVTFDGESNDGVFKWMEDEDYFEFSDDLLIASTEKIQFRDTGIYLNSSADGQLDIVADTEVQIAATTIDINGAADISGNLGVGGNLTVTGTTTFNGGTITMGDAATDNVVFGADVNSSIIPNTDDTYDLGSASQEWRDLYIDGTAYLDAVDITSIAADTTVATDKKIQFRDSGLSINSSADGQLDIIADTEVQIAATTIDINGNVEISGDLTISGDDLTMGTNTAGHILVADGTNFNPTAVGDLSEISSIANDDVFLAVDTSGGGLKKVARSTVVSGLATSAAISNVVEDTSPQLGGNLDTNSQNILIDDAHFIGDENGNEQIIFQTTSSAVNQFDVTNAASGNGPKLSATGSDTNIDLDLLAKGSGIIKVISPGGSGNSGAIQLNCESNSHGQILKSQPHSASATNTMLLPEGASSTLVSLVSTDTLTNKTLTSPKINEDVAVTSTATELNRVDLGTTAVGTAIASKAVILDANKDYTDIRNLTITGELDAATGDFSGAVDVATDLTVGDDVSLTSDAAVLAFGADSEVTLTHVHNDGLLLNSDNQLQFRDSAINIRSDADGDLDINADDEIELNSTLIDVNGNLDVSGTIVGASTLSATTGTFSGILKTDDATEATSTTDGSLQTDGGLSVVKDAVFGDDIKLLSDASVIHFGADSEVTLTHTADVGLALKHTATADDKPIVLTLQTGETDMAANDVIGKLAFQAPDEGTGTDAILVAAAVQAVAEGDFSSSNNATRLEFHTGASELAAVKMTLNSTGAVKPVTYQETYVSKSAASTVTCDLSTANHFAVTLDQNTTFAFTNPPASGTSFAFTLIVTQHSTAVTLTWPGSVDWAGGSAPDAAGNNEVQAYGFITRDGGTTYYGFLGGTAIA